jgi:hypothetical protein
MPGARLPMRKIRDMLRLTAAGMSSRKIAASLSIGGGSGFLPRIREASDERIQSLDRRSGMLRVLRQAAAGHQWSVAAVARRERSVLL